MRLLCTTNALLVAALAVLALDPAAAATLRLEHEGDDDGKDAWYCECADGSKITIVTNHGVASKEAATEICENHCVEFLESEVAYLDSQELEDALDVSGQVCAASLLSLGIDLGGGEYDLLTASELGALVDATPVGGMVSLDAYEVLYRSVNGSEFDPAVGPGLEFLRVLEASTPDVSGLTIDCRLPTLDGLGVLGLVAAMSGAALVAFRRT